MDERARISLGLVPRPSLLQLFDHFHANMEGEAWEILSHLVMSCRWEVRQLSNSWNWYLSVLSVTNNELTLPSECTRLQSLDRHYKKRPHDSLLGIHICIQNIGGSKTLGMRLLMAISYRIFWLVAVRLLLSCCQPKKWKLPGNEVVLQWYVFPQNMSMHWPRKHTSLS